MLTANTVEILQKLQDGAAKNNATVMLQGENFRITCSDGTSQLWEPKSDNSFVLLEDADANGNKTEEKTGGTASLADVIQAMIVAPPKEEKKAKIKKDDEEDDKKHSHAHR